VKTVVIGVVVGLLALAIPASASTGQGPGPPPSIDSGANVYSVTFTPSPVVFGGSPAPMVNYTASGDAPLALRLVIARQVRGVKVHGSCVPKKKGLKGKSCLKAVSVGSITQSITAGTGQFPFTGVNNQPLPPGKYDVTAGASNSYGGSARISSGFSVAAG
jgi:hypothetical protein